MPEAITPEAIEYYKKGEHYILAKDYEKAIKHFQRCLKIQPGLSAAHRNIASSYSLLNDFESAIIHYEIIMESDTMYSRAMYYELADAYYKSGLFRKALQNFKKFKVLQEEDLENFGFHGEKEDVREAEYLPKLENSIRASQVAMDSVNFGKITNVENLGPSINTRGDEYFPFVSNDQQMLYFTQRKKGDADENLLYSNAGSNGKWKSSSPFKFFNTPAHEGRFTMVRDGRKMFFTACNRQGVLGPCDIWEGELLKGEISEIKPISGDLNSMKWESQVSVSCDGSTLFFASNRPGGMGGTDIWYSKKNEVGYWGEPINLGEKVNSPGDEESPFLTNDGQTLYFSSTGHQGMGQLDIFMSWLDENTGEWSAPINLGQPLNSPSNDFGFFLCADGKTGYFSSDKPNGLMGYDYDIYKFELSKELYSEPITFVEGFVRDTLVDLPVREAIVNLPSMQTKLQTDQEGRFFLCLPAGTHLPISVDFEHYEYYENQFDIPQWDNKQFYNLYIDLAATYELIEYEQATTRIDTTTEVIEEVPEEDDPKEDVIRNNRLKSKQYVHTVLFDFDSYDLEPDETGDIGQFISPLLNKNITRVEIIGYADDVGPDTYNLKLSEKRAKEIALYLMENSVEVDQIYLEGRGELRNDKPKNLNRKVNIKIFTLE